MSTSNSLCATLSQIGRRINQMLRGPRQEPARAKYLSICLLVLLAAAVLPVSSLRRPARAAGNEPASRPQNPKAGSMKMAGDVQVASRDGNMNAERMTYDPDGTIRLTGKAVMIPPRKNQSEDGIVEMRANEIIVNPDRTIHLAGDAVLIQSKGDKLIKSKGERITIHTDENGRSNVTAEQGSFEVMPSNAELKIPDTVKLQANRFYPSQDGKTIKARGNVRLKVDNIDARCGELMYRVDKRMFLLKGSGDPPPEGGVKYRILTDPQAEERKDSTLIITLDKDGHVESFDTL